MARLVLHACFVSYSACDVPSMRLSSVRKIWEVTEEENEEFADLMLTMARASSGAGNYLSVFPVHLLQEDDIYNVSGPPVRGAGAPVRGAGAQSGAVVLDWDISECDMEAKSIEGTADMPEKGQVPSLQSNAWVETAEDVAKRQSKHWASHAVWALVHFFTTVLASVVFPLAVALFVELSEGSKISILVLFASVSGSFLFVAWRVFWVCSGVRSTVVTPVVYWTLIQVVTSVSLWGPESFSGFRTLGVRSVWFYVLSALCFDAAQRPFGRRLSMILGFIVSALPFYVAPMLHEWLDAREEDGVSVMGSSWNVLFASAIWTILGFAVTTAGGIIWRKGTVRGRKTLKVFEFNVHMEVALTTGGMQLFSGDAMVLYVAWAVGVYAVTAVTLLPATRRIFATGSTPALHIVRRFVNLVAVAYGIFLGLFYVQLCTWIQWFMRPECYEASSDRASRVALTAPTMSKDSGPLWLPCALWVMVSSTSVIILAVCALRHAEIDFALPSRPGNEAAKEAQWVTNMAKQKPLTMLLGIARVCTWRSRIEVRGVIIMQLLLMPYFWFALSDGATPTWTAQSPWFQC